MKKLSQLLTSIQPLQVVGDTDVDIIDLINDSRQARDGVMFVAVKGVAVDSHRFIPDVAAAGARAIVCEDMPETLSQSVTYIQVENSVIALAHLADEWFDHPSKALRLVGVTGTNG
jgi:UDP-N-acetylmuramoyl-L-alanyl-D-glutamate--2,6-diaminopimelate ligase